jgi:hypothetical protein
LALGACVLGALPARAVGRFVTPKGADAGNDCTAAASPCRTISYAATQSASGDVVNVATGNYRDNIRIETPHDLTFLGGWDEQFAIRDPLGAPSVVRGGRVRTPTYGGRDRPWTIIAENFETIAVTIDGFVLRNGRAGTRVPDTGRPLAGGGRAGGGLLAFSHEWSALTLEVRNSIVMSNRDEYGGAGLSLWALDASFLSVTLDTVSVIKNRAINGGSGGILIFAAPYDGAPSTVSATLTNCVVAGNRSLDVAGGIGISNKGSLDSTVSVTLESSTVTKNILRSPAKLAPGSNVPGGGGIFIIATAGPANVTFRNSIVWGNVITGAGIGADVWESVQSGTSQLVLDTEHNDLGDVVVEGTVNDGGGNIDADPDLDRHYRLAPGSPAIDAGTCTGAPATDVDGDPRPSGPGCDLGADELVP